MERQVLKMGGRLHPHGKKRLGHQAHLPGTQRTLKKVVSEG